jgi:hypothetical protein
VLPFIIPVSSSQGKKTLLNAFLGRKTIGSFKYNTAELQKK